MTDLVDSDNMTDILEEETEEEKQFQQLKTHQLSKSLSTDFGTGMHHSATTDTLDSVYLDPPVTEQEMDLQLSAGELNKKAETEETRQKFEAELPEQREALIKLTIDDNASGNMVDHTLEEASTEEIDSVNKQLDSPPSLSKYFGKEGSADDSFAADVFDILGGTQSEEIIDDGKHFSDGGNEMTNLTFDDCKDFVPKNTDESYQENANNNHRKSEELNVDFDLAIGNDEPVETPVDIEEKDNFESFTAYTAESEALDALGMSPANPSFMTEKNVSDYFRKTSPSSDIKQSQGIGHQISVSIGHSSNLDPGPVTDNLDEASDNGITPRSIPQHVQITESSLPTPDMTHCTVMNNEVESKGPGSEESTTVHQPVFPPSTTLSPVDSPVHQPSFNKTAEQQLPSISVPTTPEHLVTAFKNVVDTSDIFSIGLLMSDADRQHDAWLPSEATKNILISMATYTPGTYFPDSELLCSPSLVIVAAQGDPVRDLVYRYMGEQEAIKRQILTANKVTQDADGLKELMSSGCYRSAFDLTGKLLADIGQAESSEKPTLHTPDTLQLWYCRFSLMMKLRMYNILESEFMAFRNLDSPDLYYEFYPQHFPGKRGSMVPFGMRLLHAELPHHLGRSQETLDRFYYLIAITKKIIKNLDEGLAEDGSAVTISSDSRKASQELWEERKERILYLIANVLVSLRDYDAALTLYDTIMEKDKPHKKALLSGLGRIHLQIGNMRRATEYFRQVQSTSDASSDTINGPLFMNIGFEAMCQNNFNEAYQNFRKAVEADPSNTSAVNNMAVCCLYLGRLSDALKSLEALVHSNPHENLHEGILFNLCTLYELESSRALHKKQALLDLVSKHKGDGFPVVCLKMA